MTTDDINALLDIMARLRDPEHGCPWDREQTFATIAPYTIEEAYEVADAIQRGDMAGLRDELGDLLLQVVFHSQMARERGEFDWRAVVAAICAKLIRRHPHVFADEAAAEPADVRRIWEEVKEDERGAADSLMDGVPRGMGELQRAVKLQQRAARVGFDWPAPEPVLDKLHEEAGEVRAAMARQDAAGISEELGDLLFAAVNLARQLHVDPGSALRAANAKFERRFRQLERTAGGRAALQDMTPDEMEALWTRVKQADGAPAGE